MLQQPTNSGFPLNSRPTKTPAPQLAGDPGGDVEAHLAKAEKVFVDLLRETSTGGWVRGKGGERVSIDTQNTGKVKTYAIKLSSLIMASSKTRPP
jgi:hypothetical protein